MISIGILAYNEEDSIQTTLRSLARQTLLGWAASGEPVEVCVVANGCRDATAARAEAFCREAGMPGVRFRLCKVVERGKLNAWNRYVHEFADAGATTIVLMDADIVFRTDDALQQLCDALRANPAAVAASGLAYKDIELTGTRNPLLWLSGRLTRLRRHDPVAIVRGQLTAYKADAVRQLWLPPAMLAEEGYVKDLLVSEFLAAEPDPRRILSVPAAGYVFQAYRRWKDIVSSQVRMRVGELQRFVVMRELRRLKHAGLIREPVCQWVRQRHAESAAWLDDVLARHVRQSGFWVMGPHVLRHRLSEWRRRRGLVRWLTLPVTLAGSAGDALLSFLANRKVKHGSTRTTELWTDTRSAELKLEYAE